MEKNVRWLYISGKASYQALNVQNKTKYIKYQRNIWSSIDYWFLNGETIERVFQYNTIVSYVLVYS